MQAETPIHHEMLPTGLILEARALPLEEGKGSRSYEISAGDHNFGTLKMKHEWKIIEWEGDDIFHNPEEELLDKLRKAVGMKKKTGLITSGIVYQDQRKTPQFTAAIAGKKKKHKLREYKGMVENPSRIVEIRYDTDAFQVIAYNPEHNNRRRTVRLKVPIYHTYTSATIRWIIDHHAERDLLPPIDELTSAARLSELS